MLSGYPAWCVGASLLGPYLNEWDVRIESYVEQTETVPAPSEHLIPVFPCSVLGPLGQASSLVEDLHLAFPPIQHSDTESLLYVLSRTWGCKDKEFMVCIAFYDNIFSCPSLLGPGEMPHVWVPPPTTFSDLSSVVRPSCGFDVMSVSNWAFMGRPLEAALPSSWVDLSRLGGQLTRLSTLRILCQL